MPEPNLIQWLGIPSEFGYILLAFGFLLCIATVLQGLDFGVFKIPEVNTVQQRKKFGLVGSLVLVTALLLHFPFWRKQTSEPSVASADGTPQANSSATPLPTAEPKSNHKPKPDISAEKPFADENRPRLAATPVESVYKINILVPTSMKVASVRLNGAEASVIRRTANVITIEAPSELNRYQIELVGVDGKACKVAVMPTAGETPLTPCQN